MPVDFGKTSKDYAAYRTVFPTGLFTRLAALGLGLSGQRVADIGTGTGILARGFAAAGCTVTGVDISPELLAKAGQEDGTSVTYQLGPAEDTGLPAQAWDVVSAGQCWHWFDRTRAAAEARRLLVAGGALVICYRDYLNSAGSIGAVSDDVVLRHNPNWPLAAGYGGPHEEWATELTSAGFTDLTRIDFDIDVPFTHEAWRGRMRSSNGVSASLSPAEVTAFDADLATVLRERFPQEPLVVPHHIWAIMARRASTQ